MTITAGMMAINLVRSLLIQGLILILKYPSMTICPAKVPGYRRALACSNQCNSKYYLRKARSKYTGKQGIGFFYFSDSSVSMRIKCCSREDKYCSIYKEARLRAIVVSMKLNFKALLIPSSSFLILRVVPGLNADKDYVA
jgi:hypothetical protein